MKKIINIDQIEIGKLFSVDYPWRESYEIILLVSCKNDLYYFYNLKYGNVFPLEWNKLLYDIKHDFISELL